MESTLSIIQVSLDNFDEEMKRLMDLLAFSPYKNVCIDTGFTPFLRVTPRGAPELKIYEDMKYNTANCILFQVGFSLCDDQGNIGGCWQFNLCDPRTYVKGETTSLFHKFEVGFRELVVKFYGRIKWVTFHGMYDLAFLINSVLGLPIPNTKFYFLELVRKVFGRFYDLKAMVKHYKSYLGPLSVDKLGLGKVTQMVGFKLLGKRHHAGPDSLATAQLLSKFFEWDRSNSRLANFEDYTKFEGVLYGLSLSRANTIATQGYATNNIREVSCVVGPRRPPYVVVQNNGLHHPYVVYVV